MAPGIIILIMYFLAMALTGEVFIIERKDGLIDRHVASATNSVFIRKWRTSCMYTDRIQDDPREVFIKLIRSTRMVLSMHGKTLR